MNPKIYCKKERYSNAPLEELFMRLIVGSKGKTIVNVTEERISDHCTVIHISSTGLHEP